MSKLKYTLIALFFFACGVFSQTSTVTLTTEAKTLEPGKPFTVYLHFTVPKGWHTYGNPAGDVGTPAKVRWDLPSGFQVSELHFPQAHKITTPPFITYGYEEAVTLKAVVVGPSTFRAKTVQLKGQVSWLICKELCIPQKAEVSLELPVKGVHVLWVQVITSVIFAFLGGLILNLMPCVFPVLSLKVLGFAQQAADQGRSALGNAWGYTAGILVSFWGLAGVLMGLRAAGLSLGWGFQLQSPVFVVGLSGVLWLLSLNFWGIFEIGLSLTSLGQFGKKSGPFLTGVLATVVAAPCTAPFMGSAMGFALSQPMWVAFLVFTALGFGLAFPYIVLSAYPRWLKFLPKPGAWMETFKQGLGFPLAATVLWLLWVLAKQTSSKAVIVQLGVLLGMGFFAWVYGKSRSTWGQVMIGVAIGGLMIVSVLRPLEKSRGFSHDSVKSNSADQIAAIDSLRKAGKWVFVDVSAAWCLTCQVNEKLVLNTSSVQEDFQKKQVQIIKLDWTDQDPLITRYLAQFNRSGVPFYVLYPGTGSPILLPELLTVSRLKKSLL